MLRSEMSIVRTIEEHRARDPTGHRWIFRDIRPRAGSR